jgi:hypothetical protein
MVLNHLHSPYGIELGNSSKIFNIELPYESAVLLLGKNSPKSKTSIQTKMYT